MQYTLKKSLGQHFLIDKTVCEKIRAVLLEQPIESVGRSRAWSRGINRVYLQYSHSILQGYRIRYRESELPITCLS